MVLQKYQRPLTIPQLERATERKCDIIVGMFAGATFATLIWILIVVLI